jgi:hypothetical protein
LLISGLWSTCGSWAKEDLDRSPLIHRPVTLGGLLERQFEVEDFAGVDLAVPNQVHELGQETAHRGRAAVQVHVAEEQLLPRQPDAVGNADVADMAPGAGGANGLHHRLLGADRLDNRVRAQPVSDFLDLGNPLVATLCNDVGCAVLAGQLLPWLVAAHRDDPLRPKLLGGQHGKQTNRAVTNHDNGLARADLCSVGGEPAGAKHIGGGEEAPDLVRVGDLRCSDKGAVGQGDPQLLGLGRAHAHALDTGGLVAGPADLAGVVGGLERGALAGASATVLDAIARALKLDDAERAHLFHLAHAADGTSAGMRPRRRPAKHWAPRASLHWVLDTITAPAIVRNGRMDLLATNHLGQAMHSSLYDNDPSGQPNFARYTFLDDDSHRFYPDWDTAADTCVAILRTEAGRDPYNKGLHDLVGELSTRSEDFRRRWSAHNVRYHGAGTKHFHHRVVGNLELAYESVDMISEPRLTMTIYAAQPGSPTEHALALLASWAATQDVDTAAQPT